MSSENCATNPIHSPPTKPQLKRTSFGSFSMRSSKANGSTSQERRSTFILKLLPHRRRQTKEVQRTSSVLDEYTSVLGRDSAFFGGEEASVATTVSLQASQKNAATSIRRTSNLGMVENADVAYFVRSEITLGELLGKGQFSKVYAVESIDLESVPGRTHDETAARLGMAKNAQENKGLYAIKHLRQKLLHQASGKGGFTRAAAALVLESQFLSKLEHPHILKLRGIALGGAKALESGSHDGYFLILDRLSETLTERIYNVWKPARLATGAGSVDVTSGDSNSSLVQRKTQYAEQLASALSYLHDRRIMFRDIKPNNLGFSIKNEDSIQLFDFGMARELPAALGLGSNEMFHMTQGAGTQPYLAPEVATNGLYNLKADVYSFSMTVYELMVEELPFAHHMHANSSPLMMMTTGHKKAFRNNRAFCQAVFLDHERPIFSDDADVPEGLQQLLQDCWQADLFKRPTMSQVHNRLQSMTSTITPVDDVPATVVEASSAASTHTSTERQAADVAPHQRKDPSLSEFSDMSTSASRYN